MRGATPFDQHYTMHSLPMGGARSQQLAGTLVVSIMRLVGCKILSVAGRYVGATTSRSNRETKRVKTHRRQTLGYDTKHTEFVFDQPNQLPSTPVFKEYIAAFSLTPTPGPSDDKVQNKVWVS